jgi:hypothetical protein
VTQVAVRWAHSEGTRINPLIDGARMFQEMVRIRWCDLDGKYEGDGAIGARPGGALSEEAASEV